MRVKVEYFLSSKLMNERLSLFSMLLIHFLVEVGEVLSFLPIVIMRNGVARRRKRKMKEPLTEELLEELLNSSDPKKFADKYDIESKTLSEYLQQLLDEKELKRPDVIKRASINDTFGYEIFIGKKNPSRDYVLRIAFSMGLNLRETNRILKLSHANELYVKNRRDAIIIFCLDKGYSLQKTDEELYRFNEQTIC